MVASNRTAVTLLFPADHEFSMTRSGRPSAGRALANEPADTETRNREGARDSMKPSVAATFAQLADCLVAII